MAAAASAGSRGAGREATGRAVDGPPARWRAPTRTRLGTRNWPGRGSSPLESRGRGPRGPGPHAHLFPRGGPEALNPAALPGGVPIHLAPPPRGDMLGLGSAFPATADPMVSEEGQPVSSTSLMQAPPPQVPVGFSLEPSHLGAQFPWNGDGTGIGYCHLCSWVCYGPFPQIPQKDSPSSYLTVVHSASLTLLYNKQKRMRKEPSSPHPHAE